MTQTLAEKEKDRALSRMLFDVEGCEDLDENLVEIIFRTYEDAEEAFRLTVHRSALSYLREFASKPSWRKRIKERVERRERIRKIATI